LGVGTNQKYGHRAGGAPRGEKKPNESKKVLVKHRGGIGECTVKLRKRQQKENPKRKDPKKGKKRPQPSKKQKCVYVARRGSVEKGIAQSGGVTIVVSGEQQPTAVSQLAK